MAYRLVPDCKYGQFLIPPHDQYVGLSLAEYGEYSEIELELLLQFVAPGTRVVVAGANFGALVVPLARRAAEVIAFEPQRYMHQLLCANVALNDLTNVRAYWAALGKQRGVVAVPTLDPMAENNFGGLELERVQQLPGDAVPVFTLDTTPDPLCGLLTIDVEGMELDVLQGGEQMIKLARPVIFFEADRVLKRGDVFRWLRARNYNLYWYRSPLFNPKNHRGRADNLIDPDVGSSIVAENVLALPRERGIETKNLAPVLEA